MNRVSGNGSRFVNIVDKTHSRTEYLKMAEVHPELAGVRRLPAIPYNRLTVRLFNSLKMKGMTSTDEVEIITLTVPGPEGAPEIELRIFRPRRLVAPAPALFWVHGGGMVIGSPEQDDRTNAADAAELGIVVAAVRYRLAPKHPHPAPTEDAYAGLRGFIAHAKELGVDVSRIAIGGASAGGGIAAAVALMAHDRGGPALKFQLLVYPMIDDRTLLRPDTKRYVWTTKANRFGWTSLVGPGVTGPDVSPYAAPSRRQDLSGLPPAWIGVGELDLFYDEDLEYARRLREAGVPCQLDTVPGAFHGFNALFPKAQVSRDFERAAGLALRDALFAK